MRRSRIFAAVIILVLIFGFTIKAISQQIDRQKKDEIYKELEIFSDSLALIQAEYVDEVKPKDMIYGALKGMLSSLDAHSQFLDPESYKDLREETEGKFGGLGIEVTIKDGLITVITPIEDTPAWKAGIKAGDKIVKIDKNITKDMSLSDSVKNLRGKPGTEVNLVVLREKEGKLLNFKITRDIINIKDIKEARVIDDKIGYIRLIEFRENTAKDLREALSNLEKQGIEGLIIDLRNNPGGLLEAAVHVTEEFLPSDKPIVSIKGRGKVQNSEFKSHLYKSYTQWPMVVLVNEGSASGSEIFAGALQDYKRAIILGVNTFGKGSVQTVIPLKDGSALRLTTSKYYTPKGRTINKDGIKPDIVVESDQNHKKPKADEEKKLEDVFEEVETTKEEPADNFKIDNQMQRAIDVIKALRIYQPEKIKKAS